MKLAVLALLAVACGHSAKPTNPVAPPKPQTLAERALAVLPDGAQIVVELDLARLRANDVVGEVATRVFADVSIDAKLRLPGVTESANEPTAAAATSSPLAHADLLVLASYGVGTPQATTLTLLATKDDIAGATRLSPELVVLGPEEWVRQVEARAGIAARCPMEGAAAGTCSPLQGSEELLRMRDHAMPDAAPGAVLRVTALLSFDARVAMARQVGIELAPARLSVWADVVDDFAMVIDADAADPGDKTKKDAVERMRTGIRRLLAEAAAEPALRLLGVTSAINDARFVEQKTWVRAIVAIGPRQLARVVERAKTLLPPSS
ncbi:MAG TPA: hypothetical protein VMZ53_30080 [Kofleriaceae bacterium]|nr:hypothetical protein [Kofleriaceae bacterium]